LSHQSALKTRGFISITHAHIHTCTSAKAHLLTFEKLVHNPFQATASTNTTTFKLIKQYKNKLTVYSILLFYVLTY